MNFHLHGYYNAFYDDFLQYSRMLQGVPARRTFGLISFYPYPARQCYTLATPARCKRCGVLTVLSCDTCGLPVCANHSRVTTTDMARLCLSCLGAKAEVRA